MASTKTLRRRKADLVPPYYAKSKGCTSADDWLYEESRLDQNPMAVAIKTGGSGTLDFLRVVGVITSVSMLSACSTLDVWSYKASKLSGTDAGKTAVVFIQSQGAPAAIVDELAFLERDVALTAAVNAQCPVFPLVRAVVPVNAAPPMAPLLVPIVAALVQLGFETSIGKKRRDVEAITESASATYAVNTFLSPEMLAAAKCVLIARYTENEKGVTEQMTTVLKVDGGQAGTTPSTNVIHLKPVFARAKTAVATTRDGDEAKVSFSYGMSIKAVAQETSAPIARLVPTGEAAASASGVVLGGVSKCTKEECKGSDLLPYPTNRGTLSVSIAVTEQGATGLDGKAVDADLAAIKGALGPAFAEAITTKFGD